MNEDLIDLLRKTVFQLVVLKEDHLESVHYCVYDNELYECVEVNKEQYDALKKFRDGEDYGSF